MHCITWKTVGVTSNTYPQDSYPSDLLPAVELKVPPVPFFEPYLLCFSCKQKGWLAGTVCPPGLRKYLIKKKKKKIEIKKIDLASKKVYYRYIDL